MTSIATTAFESALERLNAQVVDPPERRPAYDVFGSPATPLPALGGLPRTGAIAHAARALDAGETTCVELTELALARIAQDEWTAFVEVCAEEALAEARARDGELRAGRRRGPLHGIPVSVKDVINVSGRPHPVRVGRLRRRTGGRRRRRRPLACGRRRDPREDLHARVRARRDEPAGAQSARRDPDPRRVERRLGDRGGHGHGPRLAGHRHARVDPRAGRALRRRRPQADVRHGPDPRRGAAELDDGPRRGDGGHGGGRGARARRAAPGRHRRSRPPPAGASATCASVWPPPRGRAPRRRSRPRSPPRSTSCARLVASVRETDRPTAADFGGANAMGLLVSRCEAATFHRARGLDRSLYWAEVRDQLNAADGVLATDYIDAQRYRASLREEMLAVFREHHVLAMPTAPVLAPAVERADEYLTILSRNAILWSFVGFPAISVPCPTDGLPVGLQLVAGPGGEALLIALATALTKGDA